MELRCYLIDENENRASESGWLFFAYWCYGRNQGSPLGRIVVESTYRTYLRVKDEINRSLVERYGNRASLGGILMPSLYFSPGRPRIAFVFKEVCNWKEDVAWSPCFDPENEFVIPEKTNIPMTKIKESFSSLLSDGKGGVSGFGYFNLSMKAKDLEGGAASNASDLRRAYNTDKHFLWEILQISEPDFIVFGGTFEFVWDDLLEEYGDYFFPLRFTKDVGLNAFKEKELSAWKMKDKASPVLIQTYHPSYSQNVFSEIPRVIEEVRKGAYFLEKYEIK